MGSHISKPITQLWSYTMFSNRCNAMSQTRSYMGSHIDADAISQIWSYTGSHQPKGHDVFTLSILKVQSASSLQIFVGQHQ
ncbi:hypothetical protein F383_31480 [Gossypium arboreum]|uniref:Uncharacterized protein n=1 Tax=Gossypium arboreum TaxID=29729 RepID=A0A0B0MTW2_GOSAR|nr:hypothetical protein F383_31480 [Gossypium arboreum]